MAEHLETILEQTAALRAPLAGDAPAGADLFLEPEVEPLKAEIEKLTSIEGGAPDWRIVVDRCEELLSNRTKDLRLAIWMTVAGAERSGWRGLVRGLAVVSSYVNDLYEPMFPTRPKARTNIVLWLMERAQPIVEKLDVTLSDGDDVRVAAKLIEEIDRNLADKLGDAFSGIRGLVSAGKNRVRDIPEPPPPPKEEPPPAASDFIDDDAPAAKPAPAAPPPGSISLGTSAADAVATTGKLADSLVTLARSMLLADTSRAWAYRLHRQAIWMRHEAISIEGVPGPDAGQIALLGDLAAAARWQELAVAGEEQSARCPLWLDPHRFVALALEHMGSAFIDAREAVGRDTSDFVRRNAWLLEAKFSDGIPLASAETIEWVQGESNRWQRGFTSRATELARDEERELADRFAEAKNLVAAGRHVEGLAIAIQLARRGADTRERFRSSLAVARLAMNAGAHEVARPILEGLVAIATAHSLETWDPTLCAQLYAGLYRCLPLDAPDRAKIFEVLCRLDPGQALRAQGAAAGGPPVRPIPAAPRAAPVMAPASSVQATPSVGTPASAAVAPAEPAPEPVLKRVTNPDSEWFDDD